MPWVRTDTGFLREPVVQDFCDALDDPMGGLHALALRLWVGEFFPSGVITASARRIEEGAHWRGAPGRLFAAAVKSGLLVKQGDAHVLYKWEEENGAIWRKICVDRERAQEAAKGKRESGDSQPKTRKGRSHPPTGTGTELTGPASDSLTGNTPRYSQDGPSINPGSTRVTDGRYERNGRTDTHTGGTPASGVASAAAVCVFEVPEGQEPEGPEKPRLVLVPAEDEVRKEVQRAWLAYLVMRPGEVFSDAYQRALTIAVVRRGSAVRESFDGRAHHPDNLVPKMAPFLRLLTDAAITKGLDLRRDKRWRDPNDRRSELRRAFEEHEAARTYDYDAGIKSLKEVSADLPWNRGGS